MAFTLLDVLGMLQMLRRTDLPVDVKDMGIMVYHNGRLVPLGQLMSQFSVSSKGIIVKNAQVVISAGCGHLIKDLRDLSGFCMVCNKIICSQEGCLEFCEETGVTVCRRCRVVTMDGRIVARPHARKLTSILKSITRRKHKEDPNE